ncbi:MAG: MerR family transcriptional regulator [Candidatus Binataceae bacterium]
MARRQQHTASKHIHATRHGAPILVSREVFCVMTGISERQLSVWEHEDFVVPAQVTRTGQEIERLYDRAALERARVIRTLSEELEVNLPGIGVILNLLDQLER